MDPLEILKTGGSGGDCIAILSWSTEQFQHWSYFRNTPGLGSENIDHCKPWFSWDRPSVWVYRPGYMLAFGLVNVPPFNMWNTAATRLMSSYFPMFGKRHKLQLLLSRKKIAPLTLSSSLLSWPHFMACRNAWNWMSPLRAFSMSNTCQKTKTFV